MRLAFSVEMIKDQEPFGSPRDFDVDGLEGCSGNKHDFEHLGGIRLSE